VATQGAGVYCINTLSPQYAHLWCENLNIVAIVLAVPHIIRFERRTAKHIDPLHMPLAKLWTFKGFVFLQFVQLIIFGLLNGQAFTPTTYITYDDLYYGIPATITCMEAWLFTALFMWSFSTKEYQPDNARTYGDSMPFWQALCNSFNIGDIFGGISLMFRLLMEGEWQPEKSRRRTESIARSHRVRNRSH